jgi:hypothetical protein
MHTILYDRKSSQIEHVSRRIWRYQRRVTRICNYKKDRQHNTFVNTGVNEDINIYTCM